MKRGFTLLLCEDDRNDIVLFEHAVEESSLATGLPIRIKVVRDGESAINYLSGVGEFGNRTAHAFPDLVVLDLKMPRVSGLEVLRWLKEHPEYKRLPKIMLSGSAEETDIEEAYELGVNTYFQKPGGLHEFRELIHHMISYWAHTQRPVIRHILEKLKI